MLLANMLENWREKMLNRSKKNLKYQAQRRSEKQEKELAKKLNGQVTKASGSQTEKGDVRVRGLLRVEAKTTSKKSFSITREMIEKINNAAIYSGENPAMVIEFIDEQGKPLHEVAVVPTWALKEYFLND